MLSHCQSLASAKRTIAVNTGILYYIPFVHAQEYIINRFYLSVITKSKLTAVNHIDTKTSTNHIESVEMHGLVLL